MKSAHPNGIAPTGTDRPSTRPDTRPATRVAGAVLAFASFSAAAQHPLVERISVASDGSQGNSGSEHPAISGDARYIVFHSDASTLVVNDNNGWRDVFVRDRLLNTTTRVSLAANGAQLNRTSEYAAISGNGMRIVFSSEGAILPDSGFNNCYLLDRSSGNAVFTLIDRRADNGQASPSRCYNPTINRAGTRVAFSSPSDALITPGTDTNNRADVFIRDLASQTTRRVNLGPGGAQGNADPFVPRISADGGHVIYWSEATNLVAGDSNGVRDVFLSDYNGTTRRISVGNGNAQVSGPSEPTFAVSGDGSRAAFSVKSPNLPGWNSDVESILYLRLPDADQTVAISIPADNNHGNWSDSPDFSANGRWLAFASYEQLVPDAPIGGVYVRDLLTGHIAMVSRMPNGQSPGTSNNRGIRISADGRGITWHSFVSTLVPNDSNGTWDVFYVDNPLWDDTLFANGFEP